MLVTVLFSYMALHYSVVYFISEVYGQTNCDSDVLQFISHCGLFELAHCLPMLLFLWVSLLLCEICICVAMILEDYFLENKKYG